MQLLREEYEKMLDHVEQLRKEKEQTPDVINQLSAATEQVRVLQMELGYTQQQAQQERIAAVNRIQ